MLMMMIIKVCKSLGPRVTAGIVSVVTLHPIIFFNSDSICVTIGGVSWYCRVQHLISFLLLTVPYLLAFVSVVLEDCDTLSHSQ